MLQYFCLRETPDITDFIAEALPLSAENAPVSEAMGRVCPEDIRAPFPCPENSRSTRDGFALCAGDVAHAAPDTPARLLLAGECRPGSAPMGSLNRGEAWRVYTGSMLPDGADAVIMQEFAAMDAHHSGAQQSKAHLVVSAPCARGENILARGADMPQGAVLVRAGQTLRAHDVALLAQFFQTAWLRRLPVVGIISTGDEFCGTQAGHSTPLPRPANSNTLLLEALVAAQNARSVNLGTVPDNEAALQEHMLAALSTPPCDVLVVIGGSSAGGRDYSAKTIAALPGCRLSGQDQKVSTGRPLTLARVGETSILGLPGHALSLALCAQVFLTPLLCRLMGHGKKSIIENGHTTRARLGTALPARGPAPTHYPVILRRGPNGTVAWPVPAGTGKTAVLRDMNGWITVPGHQNGGPDGLRKGATVQVRLFR